MLGKNSLARLVLGLALISVGCGKSSTSDSANGTSGDAKVSGPEQDGRDFAMREIQKHWVKGSDGWTTVLNEGSDFAPIIFLRQVRDMAIDRVAPNDLTDADKMNGFEFAGDVWMKKTPAREAGDSGVILGGNQGIIYRQPRQWSQWVDYTPMPLHIQKVKGTWQIHDDNSLVQGKIPGDADYAKAGVK